MNPLTEHELRVLTLVATGKTHQEIAAELVVTPKGVTPTVNRAVRKLGANNAPHAVFLACRAGLLDGRPQRHGDHAGFAAHRYRGEEPCEACWDGERTYRSKQKRRRRQEATGGRLAASGAARGARDGRGAPGGSQGRSGDPQRGAA